MSETSEQESLKRIKAAMEFHYADAIGHEAEYQADIELLDRLIANAAIAPPACAVLTEELVTAIGEGCVALSREAIHYESRVQYAKDEKSREINQEMAELKTAQSDLLLKLHESARARSAKQGETVTVRREEATEEELQRQEYLDDEHTYLSWLVEAAKEARELDIAVTSSDPMLLISIERAEARMRAIAEAEAALAAGKGE